MGLSNHPTHNTMTNDHQVEYLSGGTIRVTAQAAAPSPLQHAPEMSRVHSSQISYTAGRDDPPPTTVLATRRRINGADTVELVPGNPASRTHIQVAVRDGLLVETAPGFFWEGGRK